MQYKRGESFRYEFKEPLPITFKTLINGRIIGDERELFEGKIQDISPRGMKMFSEANFGEHNNKMLQLEVDFILDEVMITAVGDIVWERPYARGTLYGLVFTNQPKLEQVVISELKARRRKEVQNKQSRL
jgi:hypothetical protein